jgi:hypothetical protein
VIWGQRMTKPVRSSSWQDMRRLLTSKSKIELLNLIRDLYALTTDNKDFIHTQVLTGSIPCFFGGFYPGRAWSCWRERAKIRSKVPLYLAPRRARMWLALVTYHHAPERLRRTWQMNLLADSIPPLPMG